MPIIALPGTDFSGNNNFWAVGNNSMGTSESSGATYDIMLDTPTDTVDSSGNVIGNYALFNVNTAFQGHNNGGSLAGGPTFTNAGTRVFRTQNDNKAFSTLSMSSGKWYWEVKNETTSNKYWIRGIGKSNATLTDRLGIDGN